jgi:hypothetical protein
MLASVAMGARKGWKYIPVLPAAFATLHMAYGIGFLVGVVYFGLFLNQIPFLRTHSLALVKKEHKRTGHSKG